MTRYTINEPIEPFYVPAKTKRCTISSGETSGGSGTKKPAALHDFSFLAELDSKQGRVGIGLAIGATYILAQQHLIFPQFAVLVLLAAVMYRLDSRRRRIGIAPITVSTVKLFSKLVTAGVNYTLFGGATSGTMPSEAMIWMPLFLALCLVCAPKFPTCTEKASIWLSLFLLGSGLLPGLGFVAVFTAIEYFLFIVVAIALGVDFTQNGNALSSPAASLSK